MITVVHLFLWFVGFEGRGPAGLVVEVADVV